MSVRCPDLTIRLTVKANSMSVRCPDLTISSRSESQHHECEMGWSHRTSRSESQQHECEMAWSHHTSQSENQHHECEMAWSNHLVVKANSMSGRNHNLCCLHFHLLFIVVSHGYLPMLWVYCHYIYFTPSMRESILNLKGLDGGAVRRVLIILWNSTTLTSFVFTELANTMKYEGGVLCNLVFTEWRHWVSQNEVWGRGSYITLFSPSDVTEFHRMKYGGEESYITLFSPSFTE